MDFNLASLTIFFNAESVIRQFRNSLLAQTRLPDEVVFVDDGSSDGTFETLQAVRDDLLARGVFCTLVRQPGNLGRGAARQAALEAASGDFVTWMDVDDLVRADRIEALRAALAADNAVLAGEALLLSPFLRCQASSLRRQSVVPAQSYGTLAEFFASGSSVQLQALSGRCAAFQAVGFDAAMNWSEDTDFMIRYLASGGRVVAEDGGDPRRVVYFQSFRHTPRDVVMEGNATLMRKHGELLRSAGINPDAELAAKHKRYIQNFMPAENGIWPAAAGGAPEDRTVLPQEPPPHDQLEWVDAANRVVAIPESYASLTPEAVVDAFLQGACELRLRAGPPPGTLVQSYDIVRGGDFRLALGTQLQRLGFVSGLTEDDAPGDDVPAAETPQEQEGRDAEPIAETPQEQEDAAASAQAPTAAPTFVSRYSRSGGDPSKAVVISFFFGARYYHACGERLAEQLSRQDVDYDICELVATEGLSWINVCRQKIAFYDQMRRKHQRPLLWIDADSQVTGDLSWHVSVDADFGAFLRNFKYLVGFDPQSFARLVHPGYLKFGGRPIVDRFIEHLQAVDAESPARATDDYVLQEGLLTFCEPLAILLFPPTDIVSSNEAKNRAAAVFQHTDSGNVSAAASVAVQHEAEGISVQRQIRVMREAAAAAIKRNLIADAVVFLKRIRQLDPNDVDALTGLLRLSLKIGDTSKYQYHYDVARKNPATRSAALRVGIDRQYEARNYAKAHAREDELWAGGEEVDRNFIRSRRYRHSFDERAVKAGIRDDQRVPMMWWEQPYPGNLGDILGPYIVEKLTGIPPRHVKSSPRLLSVGSIIKFARAGDAVWGSGASAVTQVLHPAASYRAVRGPITRAMVIDRGCTCPEVYGDPAWFLPKIFDASGVAKTHRLGLIRHFSHVDRPIEVAPDVLEIDILRASAEEIEAFLAEVNRCEAIISTSLHGLIISNAYGIPACFASDSSSARQIHGDGIKFRDYALSVGVPEFVPFDLGSLDRITADLVRECQHNPASPIDLRALAAAAPFAVLPEIVERL